MIGAALYEVLRHWPEDLRHNDPMVQMLMHRLAQAESDDEAVLVVVEHIAASSRARAALHERCVELVERTIAPTVLVWP